MNEWKLCKTARCKFREDESTLTRTMESLRWEWIPFNCKLQIPRNYTLDIPKVFNANQRRIHFRGDSLQIDWAETVKAMAPTLNMTFERFDRMGVGVNLKKILNKTSDENTTQIMEGFLENWRKSLPPKKVHRNDIIVINAGAHWTKSPTDIYHHFMMVAKVMLQLYSESTPLIVFRTTVMGHTNCGNYFAPVNSSVDTQKVFATKYQWKNFNAFNKGIIQAFKETVSNSSATSKGVRFKVLDVSMFEQRPDGHAWLSTNGNTDCLHYAIPAATYDWTILLYHLLKTSEDDGDDD